jgi:hypothetical protein
MKMNKRKQSDTNKRAGKSNGEEMKEEERGDREDKPKR